MKKNLLGIILLALSANIMSPMKQPQSNLDKLIKAIENNDPATVNMILYRPNMREVVDQRDADGTTPLTAAAFHCNLGIAAALLRAGADPNVRNGVGESPLTIVAASMGAERQHVQGLGLVMDAKNVFQDQAVCMPIVDLLLSKGADANELSGMFETPLFIALRTGNTRIANAIITLIPDAELDTLMTGCAAINRIGMPPEIRAPLLCGRVQSDLLNRRMANIGYMNLTTAQKATLDGLGYTEDRIRQMIKEAIAKKKLTRKMPTIKAVPELKK
jgi:hypothetical protein